MGSLHLHIRKQPEGSTMGDDEKQAELEKKKADVRARLEAQAAGKKAKKGFMTPERKKKLRLLLRKKAAEELKKEQERKAEERRKVIGERCGLPKDIDNASEDDLVAMIKEFHGRVFKLEGDKWDLERGIKIRLLEINELNIAVNDLRGKFIKPTLKKVSKYENKFAKLQKKAAEFNFRNQLKTVKKKEFELEDDKGAEGEEGGPAECFILFTSSTKLLVKVSLELGKLFLKNSNTVEGLGLTSISILVSTGKLLSFMSKFAVLTVSVGVSLLESVQFQLERLQLILQFSLDLSQRLVIHLQTIHIIAKSDNFIGASFAVLVSSLVEVGHLLQLDGEVIASLVTALQLGCQLFDHDLAVLEVLYKYTNLRGELGLGGLGSLQLLLQAVKIVGESSDLNGNF